MRDVVDVAAVLWWCGEQNNWTLLFSTDQNGYSLKTLYRKVRRCGPVVVVAMDSSSHVFGAFASEEIHVRGRMWTLSMCVRKVVWLVC